MSTGGRRVTAFAPGKLILLGEHAVVYGHRAVALAVERGTTVTLDPCEGPTRLADADPALRADPRLARALAAVLPAEGLAVTLATDLPVGRGMGSSAALAVALVRATARLAGREADLDECIAQGFVLERIFHGSPSGLDHTVSARGGAVVYRRTDDGPELSPLDLPAPLPLVVLDTGRAGDTAALVAGVAARRPGVDPALAAIGALVDATLPALRAGDLVTVGRAMDEDQRLLEAIGVSTPEIEALVTLARQHGALGAKLAGAGGGGVVIALCPEPDALLAAAQARGVPAMRA